MSPEQKAFILNKVNSYIEVIIENPDIEYFRGFVHGQIDVLLDAGIISEQEWNALQDKLEPHGFSHRLKELPISKMRPFPD